MEKNKKTEIKLHAEDTGFHAVEFMYHVRSELTEQFLQDKQQYLNYLKKVMEDFKGRQKKVFG
jgi:hypothetical protein